MNVEQQQVLLAWARLQLEIAISRNPTAAMDVSAETITRSTGYRKLRAWFVRLSPRARGDAVRWMRSNTDGVRQVMAAAKASGEPLSMADVTIELIDAETRDPIGGEMIGCPAVGGGIPGVDLDGNNQPYVQCPRCLMRWAAHDIGFRIPSHDPITT